MSTYRPDDSGRVVLSNGTFNVTSTINITELFGVPICPDSLSIDDIGEADSWRGRVVRGFFTVLSWFDR